MNIPQLFLEMFYIWTRVYITSFDFQVHVTLEQREWWLPGQSLDLEVVAEPSSLVCLLGGRVGGGGDIKFDPRIR